MWYGTGLAGEDFAPVPGEVGGVGAEGGFGGEGEPAAVEVGELEVGSAGEDGFGDVGLSNLDVQIVVDGPESCIEEAMGGRVGNGVRP